MWKAVPDPMMAWEFLKAGVLYYGNDPEHMYHYEKKNADAWLACGYDEWVKAIENAKKTGYKPNHIYLEE